MSTLKVGDLCEIIGCDVREDLVGLTCTVVDGVATRRARCPDGSVIEIPCVRIDVHAPYSVVREHRPFCVRQIHLKKIEPPKECASWDAIEERTGWNPTHVGVTP